MFNSTLIRQTLSATGLAIGLLACGDQPTDAEYDDVATDISAMMAEGEGSERAMMELSLGTVQGDLPIGLNIDVAGNITGRRGSVEFTVSAECTNTAGDEARCGDDTERAALSINLEGNIDTPRYDAEIKREAVFTADATNEHYIEIDGTSDWHARSKFVSKSASAERTFELAYAARYEDVLVRKADSALIAGNMTYEVTAERTVEDQDGKVERTLAVSAEATVVDDNEVVLILDGVKRYTIDTISGDIRAEGRVHNED